MPDDFDAKTGNSPIYDNITTIQISSGQTESNVAINTNGTIFCLIVVPANFDGTKISFLVNDDKKGTGNFVPYYNAVGTKIELSGIDTAITAEGGAIAIGFTVVDFAPIQTFKIVSDASQTADAVFQLFTRRTG